MQWGHSPVLLPLALHLFLPARPTDTLVIYGPAYARGCAYRVQSDEIPMFRAACIPWVQQEGPQLLQMTLANPLLLNLSPVPADGAQ